MPSFEVRSFALLARLWNTGGIVNDFSFLLNRPLTHRGFSIRTLDNDPYSEKESEPESDFFAYFPLKHDPILRCILHAYDVEIDVLCNRSCLHHRVKTCKREEVTSNSFTFDSVDWMNDNNLKMIQKVTNEQLFNIENKENKTDINNRPVRWLGDRSTGGIWKDIDLTSFTSTQLYRWPKAIQQCSSELLKLTSNTCSPFKPIQKIKIDNRIKYFEKEKTKEVESIWGKPDMPGSQEKMEDIEAAKYRCSPSLIIPGAMKAASTYLFNVLASHPQV